MDENGRPVLPGLSYGANRSRFAEGVSHFEAGVTPSSHGQVTGVSRGGYGAKSPVMTRAGNGFSEKSGKRISRGAEAHEACQTPIVVAGKSNGANGHGTRGGEVMARVTRKRKPDAAPQTPLKLLMREHLNSLRVRGYSEHTVKNRLVHIGFFIEWAYEHGLREPIEVTRPVLERYQRYLFFYRKKNGEPLTFRSQHARLVPLRVWFRWMTRQNHILHNPASEIDLPRLGRTLPKNILSVPRDRAGDVAAESRRSARPARPRHPGSDLRDRTAPSGDRQSETLRSSAGPWPDPGAPGQGQERPLRADRRAGDRVAAEVHRAKRGPSSPSNRTTSRCS